MGSHPGEHLEAMVSQDTGVCFTGGVRWHDYGDHGFNATIQAGIYRAGSNLASEPVYRE